MTNLLLHKSIMNFVNTICARIQSGSSIAFAYSHSAKCCVIFAGNNQLVGILGPLSHRKHFVGVIAERVDEF